MAIMKKKQGQVFPLGISFTQKGVHFSVAVPDQKECNLLIYKKGELTPCVSYEMEPFVGDVRRLYVEGLGNNEWEYEYEIDGQPYVDPYARSLSNRQKWLGDKTSLPQSIRAVVWHSDYDWEGDRTLEIPYQEVIAYALHIRGFTKDSSSKVKHKGTFQGLIEKIPYIKELGINQIQCMPVYEFNEFGVKTNYWGYGEGYYFAPKSSYSADGDGVKGLKDMVKACHRSGIEVVLEMPFSESTPFLMMIECLHHYVIEYHIDGFIVNPYRIPMEYLEQDPILSKTKIMKHNEEFQMVMRRFVKGDEGMVPNVAYWLKHLSKQEGIFNDIATHTGFTLNDLVSYDQKHNEINGEHNQDGPDFNYSWNCGAEGPSRKKSVMELRDGQIKNALFLLLLAQGTPCILAGDEFGNSQKGNNNVYCQDNPIGWVNWKRGVREQELCRFVKRLINLRKQFGCFHPTQEYVGIDSTGCGVPDVSYHGEMAWRAPMEVSSRQLGVFYATGKADKSSCFVVYNMHWLKHTFALPSLGKDKKWYLIASTQEGVPDEQRCLDDLREIKAEPRTIIVLEGR